jgi:hypothetical protein
MSGIVSLPESITSSWTAGGEDPSQKHLAVSIKKAIPSILLKPIASPNIIEIELPRLSGARDSGPIP